MKNKNIIVPLVVVAIFAIGLTSGSFLTPQKIIVDKELPEGTILQYNFAEAYYEGSGGIIRVRTHNNITSLGFNHTRDAEIGIIGPGMFNVSNWNNNLSYIELSTNTGAPNGDLITLPNPVNEAGLTISYPDSFFISNQSRMGNWSMTKKFTYTATNGTLRNICLFGITNTTASGSNYLMAIFNFSTCFPMQQNADNLTITYGRTYCGNTACV